MQTRTLLFTVCIVPFAACAHKNAPADSGSSYGYDAAALGTGTPQPEREVPASTPGASGASEAYGADARRGDLDESDALALRDQRSRSLGLGTAYGEQRHSRVTTTSFVRGSDHPDVTLALHYNDAENVDRHARMVDSTISTPDQTFVLSLVDERGRDLPAVDMGQQRYAIGEPGARYQLGIENHSNARYEVVASVDGLDVINGAEAGFGNRGYILEPFSSLVIDGWRTSDDTVAAFRFSSIERSYAERRGKGRNIGVIGAAFFHEESSAPWSRSDDRHDADPFPNRYAPPPPPGW